MKRPASASAARAIKRLASDEAVGSARCMHGYDVEVKAAWKADASRPHDGEISTKVDFDPDAEGTSLARATFENGDSVVIPGLTVCEARGLKVLLLQHKGALWEGVHKATGLPHRHWASNGSLAVVGTVRARRQQETNLHGARQTCWGRPR